jgi:hypothetical protein
MRSGSRLWRLVTLSTAHTALAALWLGCSGQISGTGAGAQPTGGPGSAGAGVGVGVGGGAGSGGGMAPGTVSSLPPGTTMTTTAACASAPLARAGTLVRRLTRWEYVNSVTDVLGAPAGAAIADLLPADIRANGFSNDFGGQLVSLDHATGYQAAADAVGTSLGKAATWLTPFATCTVTAAACRDAAVAGLGLRLFRRPVTAAETTAFGGLFDAAVQAGSTTAPAAAVVVVRAMLQSPQFLYRLEAQTPPTVGAVARPLDNYELATRLAYFVWASTPDPMLLEAAKGGTLTTAAGLRAQLTRLLMGPHARDMIQRYFREWLSLDDLDDANRGAGFTPQLAADMKQETLDDVADQLWDGGKAMATMFTTKTTKVTPALAKYYGLGAPDAAGRYATDALPGRQGFLTHASVLTVNGDANASIVLRGLYIDRKVLCQDVPAPPPGATSVMLAPATASERQRSDARLMNEPCKTCHGSFDPLAYAFEPFDSMGALQTKDINGNAVRQDGWLTTTSGTNVPYTGVSDYMTALAADPRVGDCFATKAAQFAMGRAMDASDQCLLEDVRARAATSTTHTFADLVTAVATSPYFAYTATQ